MMYETTVESAFVCERVPYKQTYLSQLEQVQSNPKCCIFNDIMQLGQQKAQCMRHGRQCEVPTDVVFWSCGFSCCPYSRLNPHNPSNKGVLDRLEKSNEPLPSDGVDTAVGNLHFMSKARPLFSFLENVEDFHGGDEKTGALSDADLLHQAAGNLAHLQRKFKDEGFLVCTMVVNAKHYSLPQHRRRLYFVVVALDHPMLKVHPPATLTMEIRGVLEMIKLIDFVLPPGEEHEEAELKRCQALKATEKDKMDKDTKWQDEHMHFFRMHGFRWGVVVPSARLADSPWFQACRPREKDILTVVEKIFPEIKRADPSQSVGRCRVNEKAYVYTVTPKQKIYDYDLGRLLIGRECMKLQGIDWENILHVNTCTEQELGDLAGNAFATTAVAAVILAAMTQIRIQKQKEALELPDMLLNCLASHGDKDDGC